jgi:sugar lactone lactonase YvrE
VDGPEDVAFDAQGRVYAGTAEGRIVRLQSEGQPEDFAATQGRPLGLRFDPEGNLVVCDAYRGLLSFDPRGTRRVLATEAEGVPFHLTNNLDIAKDGTIYFSDSSTAYGLAEYNYDVLEARPHGRLLRYLPGSRETRVLVHDLYFANGVALSEDESFVLVNETWRYRITRYWLKGPRAGTTDTFADDLPGLPDNLDRSPRGTFWVALFTVRNDVLDALHPHPLAKKLMSKLLKVTSPKAAPYGLVVELDKEGRLIRSFHDTQGRRVRYVTTAREHEGRLYLGTLDRWIGRFDLPGEAASSEPPPSGSPSAGASPAGR